MPAENARLLPGGGVAMKHADTRHLLGWLQQGIVTSLCTSIAAIGLFAGTASAADCQGQLSKLSLCQKTTDGDGVIGGAGCTSAYIDEYITRRRITINAGGELCVRDADLKGQTVRLYVNDITVLSGGALQIGSKDAPIGRSNPANHAAIHFGGRAD